MGDPVKGCCFSCDVMCEPEPDPDQPPTISSSISCSQWGSNGWCVGNESLNLTASDPQGYTLTITGSIGGTPFTCAAGNTCSKSLPDGNGAISYKVTASQSGKSASGTTAWKRDTTPPAVVQVVPSPTGSNGWFNTAPVTISASGSDAMSGLANAQVSVNGGAWQSGVSLNVDGVYTIDFRAVDNAGNSTTSTRDGKHRHHASCIHMVNRPGQWGMLPGMSVLQLQRFLPPIRSPAWVMSNTTRTVLAGRMDLPLSARMVSTQFPCACMTWREMWQVIQFL
jgi:hypothetical protein